MYADPAYIRSNRVNLSLNDIEMKALEVLAELNGMQRSVFARDLLIEGIRAMSQRHDARIPQELRQANA